MKLICELNDKIITGQDGESTREPNCVKKQNFKKKLRRLAKKFKKNKNTIKMLWTP